MTDSPYDRIGIVMQIYTISGCFSIWEEKEKTRHLCFDSAKEHHVKTGDELEFCLNDEGNVSDFRKKQQKNVRFVP